MSTGPLLALDLDRRRPLRLQIERELRRLIRSQALPVGDAAAVDALARRRPRRLARRRRRRVRAARRGGLPRPSPRRRADRRRDGARAGGRSASSPTPRSRAPAQPPSRPSGLRALPARGVARRRRARRSGAQADSDFAYGEPFGAGELRLPARAVPRANARRRRGAGPDGDLRGLVAGAARRSRQVLRAGGARRIGVEDPGHRWRTRDDRRVGPRGRAGPGRRSTACVVEALPDVDAVVVSPDHQFPLGVALSPERRRALVEWAVAGDRLVIEHDYDAHFRYDRHRPGPLQALRRSTSRTSAARARCSRPTHPARLGRPAGAPRRAGRARAVRLRSSARRA